MKKDNSRFRLGSGVYRCGRCGKRTRETGHGEAHFEMCYSCLMLSELENSLSDGAITQEQFDEEVKAWMPE